MYLFVNWFVPFALPCKRELGFFCCCCYWVFLFGWGFFVRLLLCFCFVCCLLAPSHAGCLVLLADLSSVVIIIYWNHKVSWKRLFLVQNPA